VVVVLSGVAALGVVLEDVAGLAALAPFVASGGTADGVDPLPVAADDPI